MKGLDSRGGGERWAEGEDESDAGGSGGVWEGWNGRAAARGIDEVSVEGSWAID